MPLAWLAAVLLALPARADEAPAMCLPAPDNPQCSNLSPDDVRRTFEQAMRSHRLEPAPRVVLAPEHEFVTFDCDAGKARAGGSNAEAKECAGAHVVTVGRSVVDMSIACPALRIEPKDTLEAWALHEGAHVKLKHVRCRRLEIQKLCVGWASQAQGRKTVTRLLKAQGAASVDTLSEEGAARFRNDYLRACLEAKRDRFDAFAQKQEDEADAEAQRLAKPRAMECAMHGAIIYLKTIGEQSDTQHKTPEDRLLDAEERGASALPRSILPSAPDATFSGR